jgi:hypothetical protein
MIGSNARKISLGIAFSLIILATIACGAGSTPVPATSTSLPSTSVPSPTVTPAPLYLSVNMVSVPRTEESQKPPYTVKAQIPNLQGSNDERVTKFNNAMADLTQEEIARFKDNARMGYAMPGSSNGSFYDQKYELLSAPGNLLSLKISINTYIEGSAHPGTHTRVVNYDLEGGTDLDLSQLFKPGSEYLQMLANYCIAQLKTRQIDFQANSVGAEPTVQNYSNWNITPSGLLITFDEYQVAAYAAGPQLVTVPYSELQSIIDSNGPLAQYIQ